MKGFLDLPKIFGAKILCCLRVARAVLPGVTPSRFPLSVTRQGPRDSPPGWPNWRYAPILLSLRPHGRMMGEWLGRGTKPHPWLPPGGGSREAGGGVCVKKRILKILFLNFQKYSYFPRLNRSCRKTPSVCLRQPPPSRREAQSNCAARATAAKAPGSRRSPALTEFAHSSHLRSTSVSSEMTAPLVRPHGESEISALPHTPDPKILGEYNSAKPSWANLPKANVAEDPRMSLRDFAELALAPILSKKGPLVGSRGKAPRFKRARIHSPQPTEKEKNHETLYTHHRRLHQHRRCHR